MTTRISTGTAVQAISSSVLCVRRDGTRVARSRETRSRRRARSASTKIEISVMIHSSRSWSDATRSITGDGGGLETELPGLGLRRDRLAGAHGEADQCTERPEEQP